MFTTAKLIQAGGKELQDRADIFWSGSNLVLVVADGAGGMSGGAEAAQFILDGIKKRFDSVDSKPHDLERLLVTLDREMSAAGAYGEATCVVVAISDGGILGASVGDSGAVVFSGAGCDNLTAMQIRKPFIGSGRAMPVTFKRGLLQGTLLVASDGLLKYTSLETIAATLRAPDLDAVANKLIDLVRYPSGALPDDVSVLLTRKT